MSESQDYREAEARIDVPPVEERGRENLNPGGIGYWSLVREDLRTHENKPFEPGFVALFAHRFGNWRMGQTKIIRAPSTLLYRFLFWFCETFFGISLWYTTKVGRRVRLWHHSGMVLGARAIGDDVHIRQNTTFGVSTTGKNDTLPIIGDRVDIGAGAVILGRVLIADDTKIASNALVLTDVPEGATAIGNPANIIGGAPAARPLKATTPKALPKKPMPKTEATVTDGPNIGTLTILGGANLDTLAMAFSEEARGLGVKLETYVPPFGQAPMALLDEADPVHKGLQAEAAAALIAERIEDLIPEVTLAPHAIPEPEREAFVEAALEPVEQLIRATREKLTGPLLIMSFAPLEDSAAGMALEHGRALLASANARLAAIASELSNTHVLPTDSFISQVGRSQAHPGEFWHIGRIAFGQPLCEEIARRVIGALLSLRGQTARLLVLDLDNTLWGGVIGEDGPHGVEVGGVYPGSAFTAFQTAIKALADRGIALALASKNDEDLALSMFDGNRDGMVLTKDDIVTHRINWTEKSHNIEEMLAELDLGQASCLFVDDNPVEREKVRTNLPKAIVPPFPERPEELSGWLLRHPFLDALKLTKSDLGRGRQYKVRSQLQSDRKKFENVDDFLKSLEIEITLEPFGETNRERILQLFVKTNQFNATTRRHDEAALTAIMEAGGEVYAIGYKDRHSPFELMGAIVITPEAEGKWRFDSFLLSCRILGRKVETAVVGEISRRLFDRGTKEVVGEIIETPRNTPVRDVYERAGFTASGGQGDTKHYTLTSGGPQPEVPPFFTFREKAPEDVASSGPTFERRRPIASAPMPADGGPVPLTPTSPRNEALEDVFRTVFPNAPEGDLSGETMETVEGWDSLGHLRLGMEIERQLGVRLGAGDLIKMTSFAALAEAVSAS